MRFAAGRPRLGGYLTIIWFMGVLWLPLLGTFFGWEWPGIKVNENRSLAGRPVPALADPAAFPGAWDAYVQDHFGFRNSLIRLNTKIRYEVLELRPERVLLGQGDWLFFAHERIFDDLIEANPFREREVKLWRQVIEGRQAWLAERGINYLFVIAPNKSSVYPENLPEDLAGRRPHTRLDQLMAGLSGSWANVLDLRPVLTAAKAKHLVYYPHDTHWSGWGGFYAYQAIIRRLAESRPGLKLPGPDEYGLKKYFRPGDLARMLALGEKAIKREFERPVLKQDRIEPVTVEWPGEHARTDWPDWRKPKAFRNPDAAGRLLVMNDSFANTGLVQNLPMHFNLSYFLFERPTYESLKLLVEDLKPDVVIEECVERDLVVVPEDHPEWEAARSRAATR